MGERSNGDALREIVAPIVRAATFRWELRLGLRSHDREDLEQELWLEWLARNGPDPRDVPAVTRPQVQDEVERIAAALARSWAFWRHVRPAPERYFLPLPEELPPDRCADSRVRDLSLDVRHLLADLPAEDRVLCESLMAGGAVAPHLQNADRADVERRIAALQADFIALDLHEYL